MMDVSCTSDERDVRMERVVEAENTSDAERRDVRQVADGNDGHCGDRQRRLLLFGRGFFLRGRRRFVCRLRRGRSRWSCGESDAGNREAGEEGEDAEREL